MPDRTTGVSVGRRSLCIRGVLGPVEYPRLVEVWRSAVDATHDFLADEDRDAIQAQLASDYLPQVDLYVAERGGVPVGFAGVSGQKLEMLFVEAAVRGLGIGSALLSYVLALGVTEVDVNEQNPQAVEFYRRRGFAVIGRSAEDDQGRPYPLLRLRLPGESVGATGQPVETREARPRCARSSRGSG